MSLDKHFTVRLSEDLFRRLRHQARRRAVSVGELTRKLIAEEVERLEGKRELRLEPGTVRDLLSTLLAMEEIMVRTFDPGKLTAVQGEKARLLREIYDRSRAEAGRHLEVLEDLQ